jgi:hypothetical protein
VVWRLGAVQPPEERAVVFRELEDDFARVPVERELADVLLERAALPRAALLLEAPAREAPELAVFARAPPERLELADAFLADRIDAEARLPVAEPFCVRDLLEEGLMERLLDVVVFFLCCIILFRAIPFLLQMETRVLSLNTFFATYPTLRSCYQLVQ